METAPNSGDGESTPRGRNWQTDQPGGEADALHAEIGALQREIDALRRERTLIAELQSTRDREKLAYDQASLIVNLMGGFLALVTLIVAGGGIWGFVELKRVRDLRKEAEMAVEDASLGANQIEETRKGLTQVWRDIDASFEDLKLPELLDEVVKPGARPPATDPEVSARIEDYDSVLVVCDRLRLPSEPSRSAEHFLKLGKYWQAQRNWPRALERVRRAIHLDARSAAAHRELGRTLAYWEAWGPSEAAVRSKRLDKARAALEEAISLGETEDVDTVHVLAWTYDEIGDRETAAIYYRRARDLEERRSAAIGAEPDRNITYNLACTLSRLHRFEEALQELETIIHRDSNFEHAAEDPDFEPLRQSLEWQGRFEELIERGERRAAAGGDAPQTPSRPSSSRESP